jgi:hypothetical protein
MEYRRSSLLVPTSQRGVTRFEGVTSYERLRIPPVDNNRISDRNIEGRVGPLSTDWTDLVSKKADVSIDSSEF